MEHDDNIVLQTAALLQAAGLVPPVSDIASMDGDQSVVLSGNLGLTDEDAARIAAVLGSIPHRVTSEPVAPGIYYGGECHTDADTEQ